MSDNNNSDERSSDITDLTTGEYPALVEGEAPGAATELNGAELNGTGSELNGAAHDIADKKSESVKVAFWLSHLESEVTRLQAKWLSIDAEFKTREARIAELHQEIKAREAAIARLTADLEADALTLKAANERLTSKDGDIATLIDERRVRDERITAISAELADAAVAHKATQDEVARAQAEIRRLNDVIRREQAASAATTEHNQHLLAEQRALQAKLQDLEIYINGRHDRWSELNTNLAEYKNSLAVMEKTVKSRDAIIARHQEEKSGLSAKILDLERQCSELAGRRMEREQAYEELQQKLAAHLAQTEQLKTENANRLKEAELATKQAVDRQRHIESLERGIERRDESVAALTAEVEQGKVSIGELTALRAKLDKRGDELEKGLAERSQQVQVLREDLRLAHEQLRLVQDQLADRTTHLASSQEALDQKSRQIERLTNELHDAQRDAVQIRADLETLGAHASELGRLRADAVAETEKLKLELASQHQLVTSLETELRLKQATADLLERSVDRITDLGASLAALDQRMHGDAGMHGGAGTNGRNGPSQHLPDFVATLAADDKVTAAAPLSAAPEDAERPSMDMRLDDHALENVIDMDERTDIQARRKLVVTIDGETHHFPIIKKHMIIGRGHASDIRIASHFVSRVHAKISTNGISTVIEDAGSKNGLLVNSERVLRRVLRDGDVVSLGDELNMRFVDARH